MFVSLDAGLFFLSVLRPINTLPGRFAHVKGCESRWGG